VRSWARRAHGSSSWARERRCGLLAALAASILAAAGCGEGRHDKPELVVSAAASLTGALTSCSRSFPGGDVRLSFGGSDELAAQIRQGAEPDVFAAANTELPKELHEAGLLEKPVAFATNELVLAVPADSTRARTLEELTKPGLEIAVGSESVPVGSYTREALSGLSSSKRDAILRNVRSEEPDVKGVVGKLTQRAVDAGFVYRSDVETTEGELDAVELDRRLQPAVSYGAGVVSGSSHREAASSYVNDLRSGACSRALQTAGFRPLSRR
jgi:molybdate transport system substrate-binding protein